MLELNWASSWLNSFSFVRRQWQKWQDSAGSLFIPSVQLCWHLTRSQPAKISNLYEPLPYYWQVTTKTNSQDHRTPRVVTVVSCHKTKSRNRKWSYLLCSPSPCSQQAAPSSRSEIFSSVPSPRAFLVPLRAPPSSVAPRPVNMIIRYVFCYSQANNMIGSFARLIVIHLS